MIIAVPIAGLCNRLRMLDSSMTLAVETNQRLGVFWNRDETCSCDFRQFFVPHPRINWILDPDPRTIWGKIARKSFYFAVPYIPRLTDKIMEREDFPPIKRMIGRTVLIMSCKSFYPANPNLEPAASPVPAIIEAIDAKGIVRADYVGVHIRRTDHHDAIRFSPLDAFVKQMEAEIQENPRTQFYVASDEENIRQQLLKTFPDRVRCSRISTFNRGSSEGIRDAIIDLYSLGRCRKILGSYQSSFSHRAAHIGNCPLVVVRQRDSAKTENG